MRRKGFTLVEVVVVVAVVALLSAIVVPLVARQIDEAKIARAKNECQVIGAAILKFHSDVGLWPAQYINPNVVLSLVSGTSVSSSAPSGSSLQYGFTGTGNQSWYDGGATSIKYVDIFDNHLNTNTPQSTTYLYATTGEFRWRGPYLAPIGKDPWGHPYTCNIQAAYSGTNTQCVVLCAGPNGVIDTSFTSARKGLASTATDPSGDDIWAVICARP